MEAEVKRRKRRVVLVALAACLVVAGIGGTLAWFSAQSSLTNTFTVGNIKPPTTDPNNPDNPDVPFPTDPDNDPRIDGNLYEPHWVKDSKIAPGASVAKDPYVGIGKDSNPAYTYVYVKNNLPDGAYFAIEQGWAPVATKTIQGQQDQYTEGLFAYTGKGVGGTGTAEYNAGKGLAVLDPKPDQSAAAKDAWTVSPLFTHIKTGATYDTTGMESTTDPKKQIEEYAYVAAKSANGDKLEDLDAAAKAWVKSVDPSQTVITDAA